MTTFIIATTVVFGLMVLSLVKVGVSASNNPDDF
ncbi:YnaM/YnfT family protein [Enterobacter sp. UNJFSC 003]